MRFKATDVFDYYKPSPCVRRVALKARGEPEQDTDTPFVELIRDLGHTHEEAHLATLSGIVNLAGLDAAERERKNLAAMKSGAVAVYQPRFRTSVPLDGETWELVGEPDFLIRDAGRKGYRIRDSKLAHDPLSSRHAGIPKQLQIYGYLYERATGEPPAGLEVHAGTDEIVPLDYEGADAVLALLRDHRRFRESSPDAYEPVGWSKCAGCGFEDRCWDAAEAAGDVSMLTTVRQDRARELHAMGIRSIADIAPAVDNPAHHDFFFKGKKDPTLTDSAVNLLRSAESFLSGKEIVIAPPVLPIGPNYAMFDLEGLPPAFDELDKTYLWGIKVFGSKPSPYLCAEAGFGPDGDREGWIAFLDLARRLLADYGPSLPFVHWSQYETTRLRTYIARYGDLPLLQPSPPDGGRGQGEGELPLPAGEGRGEGGGIAARVLSNAVDLLSVLKKSVVLPLPSYSLKVVEKHAGFARKLTEADGAWSIVRYIEATEAAHPAARTAILGEIRAYNEEDLDATSAVMDWLKKRVP